MTNNVQHIKDQIKPSDMYKFKENKIRNIKQQVYNKS